MEKEIKVRKKRFAAFWVAVLLACSFVVPMVASAYDEVKDSGAVELNGELNEGDAIRAGAIIYLNCDGEKLYEGTQGSGGWQTINAYTGTVPTGQKFQYWIVTARSAEVTQAAASYGSWKYPNSVTLSPSFTPEVYTITFDTDGGSTIDPIMQKYNTAVTEPATPTKTGHIFVSWDKEIPTIMPAENITITAKWDPASYQIAYESNGGTHENTTTSYTYNVGIESFADAEKTGYTFAGWYSDAEFRQKVESISKTTTGDITLYAKFELNSGKVGKGTYYLKKNTQYQLDGVQHVSVDSKSVYAPDAFFYVPEDGSYTFN